jgi:hypothetical protein
MVVRCTSDLSQAELLDRIGQAFTKEGKWSGVTRGGVPASPARSDWKFNGPDGRPWNGTLSIEAAPGHSGEYTLTLNIARVG